MFIHKRFNIFWSSALVATVISLLKYLFNYFSLEPLVITPLHTGILAGTVFIIGFILSSTHADYKESEKLPVDIATATGNLYQDALLLHSKEPRFPIHDFAVLLKDLLVLLKKDIAHHGRESFSKTNELGKYFLTMESLGVPPNYIVKLKQDQAVIVRAMLRMHYLLRIQPLPSAFILVESIVFIMIALLLVTHIGATPDELIITGFFSFTYVYLLKLIKVMDKPFHAEGITEDDVSMFLIEEEINKLSSDNL